MSVLLAAALLAAAPAADLRVEAITEAPLSIGAGATLEGAGRVRIGASLGWLPPPYLDLINTAAVQGGAYDENTASVIEESLRSSLVANANLGWRPFARRGFHADVGYTVISLGGGIASEDLIGLATGLPPLSGPDAGREYSVRSNVHLLTARLGWEWGLARDRRMVLRASVGAATTISSETKVEPEFQPLLPGLNRQFRASVEQYLDDTYRKYVHTATVSVSLGWRFR